MTTNDKQPERTAMQELIDWIDSQSPGGSTAFIIACANIKAKAIELRDTVEKECRKSDWIDGWNEGCWDSCNAPHESPQSAEERYNQKHTNHGK